MIFDFITAGECVAVVGAGGKTTLCWLLIQALAQRDQRAIFTTTTHIRQPAPGAFDKLLIGDITRTTHELLASSTWRTACIAAEIEGNPDDALLPNSTMPVMRTKLKGFDTTEIYQLHQTILNLQSPISNLLPSISLVVEADGARGLLLKAPAEYEPVIPSCATTVCVVANLGALGQPLDDRVAHHPERIAALTGAQLGTPITAQMIVTLLTHPQGGRKNIPFGARAVAVLAYRRSLSLAPSAEQMSAQLLSRGYDSSVIMPI